MKPKLKATLARGGFLLALAAAGFALSGGAHAGGTTAGVTISNQANLSYAVGGVNQTGIASSPAGSNNATGATTDFVVDNKINHTVVTTDATARNTVPGAPTAVSNFSVTNTGNYQQGYALSVVNVATGQTVLTVNDTIDLVPGSCVINVNGTGATNINTLAVDANTPVAVTCAIPGTAVNGDGIAIALVAQAAEAGTNGGTLMTATAGAGTAAAVDVVFADLAGLDPVADGNRDGRASGRSVYSVVTASLLVSKTLTTLCDPVNGDTQPKNIPGAFVRYTVTIANTGSASATLSQITDALNANVDFDPDLITGTGGTANCATGQVPQSAANVGFSLTYTARGAGFTPRYMTTGANADGATHAAGNITIDFVNALPAGGGYAAGELKQGESLTLVYQVKIK